METVNVLRRHSRFDSTDPTFQRVMLELHFRETLEGLEDSNWKWKLERQLKEFGCLLEDDRGGNHRAKNRNHDWMMKVP